MTCWVAVSPVRREDHDEGHVITFGFTRDARQEVARAKWQDGIKIKLFTVGQLLTGEVLPLTPPRRKKDLPTA